jgi:hypothetical protein
MKKSIFAILILSLLLSACKSNNKKLSSEDKNNVPLLILPDFDADSAYLFVKLQTDLGPRNPGSKSHSSCADLLLSKMQNYCDTAFIQYFTAKTYDGKQWTGKNIIAIVNPTAIHRIVLAAHWDSRPIADHDPQPENRERPIDGANDGASGIGVLMEVARQLHIKRPETGVDIVFFDLEDYGTPNSENIPGDWWCLGSQYWSKHLHKENYKADYGILLDMVGANNATFYHEYFSTFYASDIVSKLWGKANQAGLGKYFINKAANPLTDDHYYVNTLARIPMIDIVHQDNNSGTGFYPHWHTTQDNIQQIDKKTLSAVGKLLLWDIYDKNYNN